MRLLNCNSILESKSVQFALKRFTELEDLRGSDAYVCEKCCAPENKKMGKCHRTVDAKKKCEFKMHLTYNIC